MHDRLIQSDPDVMLGKPVVRGTRITVEMILRKLSCGESIEQILESHPRLTREGVFAAIQYRRLKPWADVEAEAPARALATHGESAGSLSEGSSS